MDPYMRPKNTVCLDFGHGGCKMAICSYRPGTSRPRLIRVPVGGNRNETIDLFKFLSPAAVDETGTWVVGEDATSKDTSIALKTILTFAAGITRPKTILNMDSGRTLLACVRAGTITHAAMKDVLRQHLVNLWAAVVEQMTENEIRVQVVMLTQPCYLVALERSGDFDKYMIRPIFGTDLIYETCSEGQAATHYFCEPFDDPMGLRRVKLRFTELFGNARSTVRYLVTVDIGASTMNIQSVAAYIDADGNIVSHQSIALCPLYL